MDENIKRDIRALRENSSVAYLGSVNEEGFPQIKAMLTLEHASMNVHYFSTNTSSKRVGQYIKNGKASVYYCSTENYAYKGLLFTGTMEICTDRETKTLLWREGFERYYPNGIDDEDYCVLKFTAMKGNYYHNLDNVDFNMEEL